MRWIYKKQWSSSGEHTEEKWRRKQTCMQWRRSSGVWSKQESPGPPSMKKPWPEMDLLAMAPRSFTGEDRRRMVDRKHHAWRNHGRNSVSCGTESPSSRFLSLSLLFFRWRRKWEAKKMRDFWVSRGLSRPVPQKAHPAQALSREARNVAG